MFVIVLYVPESHLEAVKQAMFAAGGGRFNQYDCCAWQVKGIGQFRGLDGSAPFIGQKGKLERIDEYRVEMICEDENLDAVIQALQESHPYEEPAFHYWKVNSAYTPK